MRSAVSSARGPALERQDLAPRLAPSALLHQPPRRDLWIERSKRRLGDVQPEHHARRLLGDQGARPRPIGHRGRGGHVALPDVLGERSDTVAAIVSVVVALITGEDTKPRTFLFTPAPRRGYARAASSLKGDRMERRTGLSIVAAAGRGRARPSRPPRRPETRAVFAGPPPRPTRSPPSSYPRASFKLNPDINAFFNQRTTINVGDTVSFHINGLSHGRPARHAGSELPFIVPGASGHWHHDAAGNPFWFNGKVPGLGINPQLFARSKCDAYNGSARLDSGIASSKPLNVKFTKPGTYKFFCDIHPGMVGYVVVKPKSRRPDRPSRPPPYRSHGHPVHQGGREVAEGQAAGRHGEPGRVDPEASSSTRCSRHPPQVRTT